MGVILAAASIVTPRLWAVQGIVGPQPAAGTQTNAVSVVAAQARTLTNQFVAYGQIEPIAALPIRAVEAGQVPNLEMVPGSTVRFVNESFLNRDSTSRMIMAH